MKKLLTAVCVIAVAAVFGAYGCGSGQATMWPTELTNEVEGCQPGELTEINIGLTPSGIGGDAASASKLNISDSSTDSNLTSDVICIEGATTSVALVPESVDLVDGDGNPYAFTQPGEHIEVNSADGTVSITGEVRCDLLDQPDYHIQVSVPLVSEVFAEKMGSLDPLGGPSGAVMYSVLMATREPLNQDGSSSGMSDASIAEATLALDPDSDIYSTDTQLEGIITVDEWMASEDGAALYGAMTEAGQEAFLTPGDLINKAGMAHCFATDEVTGECTDAGFVSVQGSVHTQRIVRVSEETLPSPDWALPMIMDFPVTIDANLLKSGEAVNIEAIFRVQEKVIYDFDSIDYVDQFATEADITEAWLNSFYETVARNTGGILSH